MQDLLRLPFPVSGPCLPKGISSRWDLEALVLKCVLADEGERNGLTEFCINLLSMLSFGLNSILSKEPTVPEWIIGDVFRQTGLGQATRLLLESQGDCNAVWSQVSASSCW